MRNRLLDFRLEATVQDVGACLNDIPELCKLVNTAERRLLLCKEAGDEGWMGSFAEMIFTLSQTSPYITTPRDVARLIKLNVCQSPVEIANPFHEYLRFGNGNLPKTCTTQETGCTFDPVAYMRNNAVTFVDLTSAPQYLRIYTSDTTGVDVGASKRVLVQGVDSYGNTLYSNDSGTQVKGVFVTLADPFVDVAVDGVPIAFNSITGIQKDTTVGQLQFKQVDPTTGSEILIHTMEPSEQVASYTRYYLHGLPNDCCRGTTGVVQARGIVKLELIPITCDTDYLLIQNIEALMEECRAVRYNRIDSLIALSMAEKHHKQAIGLLQGELVHYLGKEKPAMSFHPFGSWDPAANGIGML